MSTFTPSMPSHFTVFITPSPRVRLVTQAPQKKLFVFFSTFSLVFITLIHFSENFIIELPGLHEKHSYYTSISQHCLNLLMV